MITEETVFIIGAGANAPYGFPTGKGLRRQICYDWLKLYCKSLKAELEARRSTLTVDEDPYASKLITAAREFINAFRRSSTQSIDLFLARNPEHSVTGKRAIATCIKSAESQSKFREDMSDESQDWYSYLFQSLTDELVTQDGYTRIGENKVSFITFNYDRSLEHFLYTSLSNTFRSIPFGKLPVKEILPFDFIHVYGQLWNLPWQGGDSMEYRLFNRFNEVDKIKDGIRVIDERSDGNLDDAKTLISKAERVFFLGFGYAKENREILSLSETLIGAKKVVGTSFGMTDRERYNTVKQLIPIRGSVSTKNGRTSRGNLILANMTCRELLREFL